MPSNLTTDFLCIATAGNTIDGRVIDDALLEDLAKTYDPDLYTALIWPRHGDYDAKAWMFNLGTVNEVKLEVVDGKKKLFARLAPNQFLLDANANGQGLFTSIEALPDFNDSGKWYLAGLAVTDIPASLGTSRLEFNAKDNNGYEPLVFTIMKEEKKPFWHSVFSGQTKQTEGKAMDKAQFDQLIGKLDQQKQEFETKFTEQSKKIEELAGQVQTFSQQPNTPAEKPAEPAQGEKQPPAEPTQDSKNFQAVMEKLDAISAENKALKEQFSALEQKAATQLPSSAPAGGNNTFI